VAAQILSEHEFCPDTVCARNKNRFTVSVRWNGEHATESAQSSEHFRALSALHQWLNAFDKLVASIDIDACVFVGKGFIGHDGVAYSVRAI
jgi:hypothetical protein